MNMRNVTLAAIAAAVTVSAIGLFVSHVRKKFSEPVAEKVTLEQRADEALAYARKHHMNTDYVLLLDYSIPSGTPRLFVWDYERDKVVARTYVMHGVGGGSTAKEPVFSNKAGSKCSSLGKFKVLKSHGAKLRRSYRLQGLERSNSHAYKRGIMIHRSTWVDKWCWKKYIPLHEPSCQGCITVSSKGMSYLEKLIKSESTPLLLWSYC